MNRTLTLTLTPDMMRLLRELTSDAVVDAGLDLERSSRMSTFGVNRRMRQTHLDNLRSSLAVAQALADTVMDAV